MTVMDQATETSVIITEKIQQLVKQGKYKLAFTLAEKSWGPYSTWREQSQLKIAVQLLSQLGMERKAEYLELINWRRNKADSTACLHALMVFFNSRNLIYCQRFIDKYEHTAGDNPDSQAEWLAAKAILCIKVRDFTSAYALLKQAGTLGTNHSWYQRLQCYALESDGQREQALLLAEKLFKQSPNLKNLQALIKYTQLTYGNKASSKLLSKHISNYESISLWENYASMLRDIKDWDHCEYALDQADNLRISEEKKGNNYHQYLRSEITLARGELEKTKNILAKSNYRFGQKVLENLKKVDTLSAPVELNVPDIAQKHMTCAPSSIAAIIQYFGLTADEDDIANEICFGGTSHNDQYEWLNKNGFICKEFDLTEDIAITLIDNNLPFTLTTTQGMSSHLQVVKGYDKSAGVLLLMDPSSIGNTRILTDYLIEDDLDNGPRCMVFVPQAQKEALDSIQLPSGGLYPHWRALEKSSDNQDLKSLDKSLQAIKQLDPTHRFVPLGNRLRAILCRDENLILKYTEELLTRFPSIEYLTLSKFTSLKALSRPFEAIDFLLEEYSKQKQSDLLTVLINETIDYPKYRETNETLLKESEQKPWFNAEYFWVQGHRYWSLNKKEQSCTYYYWAICLDNTNYRYTESFFIAYRMQGLTDQALAILKSRYEQSISVSAKPIYSLFSAYEMASKESEGLQILATACNKHPNDSKLHLYYLSKLLRHGKWDLFDQKLNEYTPILTKLDKQKLNISKLEQQGHNLQAAQLLENLLKDQPGDYQLKERYIDSLKLSGQAGKADLFVSLRYDKNPENLSDLWLVVDHHSCEKTRILALQKINTYSPNNCNAKQQLADILIQSRELDEANILVNELIEQQPNNAQNWALKSNIHLSLNQWSEAQQTSLHALSLNIDNDDSFAAVISTHTSPQQKLAAFKYIGNLLNTKHSCGEAIWNYWHYGNNWISHKELHQFCDSMLSKYSDHWQCWIIKALQLKTENQLEKAINVLNDASVKFQLSASIYFEKAQIHALLSQNNDAIKAFETASNLSPSWVKLATEYSQFLETNGDLKAALSVVEKCRLYNNCNGYLYGFIADLYHQLDRTDSAINFLESAINFQPDYQWAWHKLYNLCQQTKQEQRFHTLLETKLQDFSHIPELWITASGIEEKFETKLELLKKAREIQPEHIQATNRLLELLIENRQDEQALDILNNNTWNDALPISISIKEPIIYANRGSVGQALDCLDKLLQQNPRYIEGWEKQLDWASEIDDNQRIIKAANTLVHLDAHSCYMLCRCAKLMLQIGDSAQKEVATEWLERAYRIDPLSSNAALLLLDEYILQGRTSDAYTHLNNVQEAHDNAWTDVRKLELALKENNYEDGLSIFSKVLDQKENTSWLYTYSLDLFKSASKEKYKQAFYLLSEYLLNQDAPEALIQAWISIKENEIGFTKSAYKLLNQDLNPRCWKQLCLAYFEHSAEAVQFSKPEFLDTHKEKILNDLELSTELGFLLMSTERNYDAKHHFESLNLFEKKDVPTYTWYLYLSLLSLLRERDSAELILQQALKAPADQYYDNLLVWKAFYDIRNNIPISFTDIEKINFHELSNTEKKMYYYLLFARNASNHSQEQLDSHLKEAKTFRKFFELRDHVFISDTKNAVINHIINQTNCAGFKAMWWKLKLTFQIE